MKKRVLLIATMVFFGWLLCGDIVLAAGDKDKIAKVGGEFLTVGEFKRQLALISGPDRMAPRTPAKKKEFLKYLIDTKLLAMAAKKQGLDHDPKVQERIKAAVENVMAAELVKREVPRDMAVTDEEARAYYHSNLDKFTQKERVLVRQIVLETQKEAEDVLAELKKGESFEKLAKEKSTDLSAKSGGLVGWLRKGRLPVEVEKTAHTLKKGETSAIIASKKGFHIIRVENRQKSKVIPYKEIKKVVVARARMEKQKKTLEDLRAELREQYQVEVNEEIVKEVIGK